MAALRKHPPANALAEIERMALKGHSTTGIAKFFNVSRACVKRWFDEHPTFEEAYEQGRDAYRQALEEQLVQATLAGRQVAGLIFLLKAKFKMYDVPNTAAAKVDVNVNNVQPVLIVKDHGTDEEWAAKAAAQQKALTASVEPRQLEAPEPAHNDAGEPATAPAILSPTHASESAPASPVAPVWTPPVWVPPQAMPVRVHQSEPISGGNLERPAQRFDAPVWKGSA